MTSFPFLGLDCVLGPADVTDYAVKADEWLISGDSSHFASSGHQAPSVAFPIVFWGSLLALHEM